MNMMRTTVRRLWSKCIEHTPAYAPRFDLDGVIGMVLNPVYELKVGMVWIRPLRVSDPHNIRTVTDQYELFAQEYIQ